MDFHERLRACREKRGLKQNEAAAKVGIKNNTLSSYENGTRQPDYEILSKLSELYDISLDYLINGSSKKDDDKNLFFFDMEGLSDEEIEDIKNHIEYVKWKAKKERGN
ncbi:helix-turn-helix domain-containing protein [Paraliobacillus sp. X-1268]|uniref:helix-turn-helix domain-containing protein n=1 Tax=Paraliobacillus sp. X-1268 TaxID=2213193 RepID=UPI000E3B62AC|nr:helix-turn-helix transcriptional regulator [Paraliobacillus sp. X-1268]